MINGSSQGVMQSTQQCFHYWQRWRVIPGEPVTEELPDPDTNNRQNITSYTYDEKKTLVVRKINGGEHAFPKTQIYFNGGQLLYKRNEKAEAAFDLLHLF